MKMLKLNRLKHNEPRFDELSKMICDLKDFLNEPADANNNAWRKNINAVIDFQDTDGSFKLFDSYRIPADAKVDFCHMPTYICTAILMKAYLMEPEAFEKTSPLERGLEMSCARNLRGHGFEALKYQIEALNIFMNAGIREFLDIHPDLCPEFSAMMDNIIKEFQNKECNGKFTGPWGESYEEEIRKINEYFSQRNVFVYGTLMKGEANHGYLKNSTFIGHATVGGYEMYDVGWYPAIIPGDGMIIGELYMVAVDDMASIDMLEGEGHLYIKKCEAACDEDGNTVPALVYVYMGDCMDLQRIPAWKEYVWYVSYGSNMLRERFLCYIRGGSYGNSRFRQQCEDTTPPLAVKTVEIPFDMYFGNISGSWQLGGVSFLDTTKEGKALGVAYLITEKQFNHVAAQENGGRSPGSGEWYEDIIELEPMDGIEVRTITNNDTRPYNEPCEAYLDTLRRGIKENWPEMSDEDIEDYLKGSIR